MGKAKATTEDTEDTEERQNLPSGSVAGTKLRHAPRVLIAGGGTGGHAIPALAIAEAIQRRSAEATVLFVGTARGVESRVVPKAGFDLEQISVISLSRSLNASLILFPFVLLKGIAESLGVLRGFKPDLTICTGGYVSGPVGLAAAMLGIPLAIHDSNVLPGITLRVLSRAASLVMLGFEDATRKVGGSAQAVVGNPTRIAKEDVGREAAREAFGLSRDRKTLLVVGGSQGARSINNAVRDALPQLMDAEVQVVWQTGPLDYDDRSRDAEPYGDRVSTVAFIDDMPTAYRAADLAVTRGGAMTIAELNLYGIPAILVPLATASENHQELNARAMERAGWAKMILQRDINGEKLGQSVSALMGDGVGLAHMSEKSASRGVGDAADRIVDTLASQDLIRL